MKRLREVANHLQSPDTSMTFYFWSRDTVSTKVRNAAVHTEANLLGITKERDELRERLGALRAESEQKLAELAGERVALLTRVSQLSGNASDAEAVLQAQVAQEREQRVELLRRQITRRIMNRDLSAGFTAWCEMWQSKVYATEKLLQVAGRLHNPLFSAAFTEWADEAAEAKLAAASSTQAERDEQFARERDEFRAELARLQAEMADRLEQAAKEKRHALDELLVQLNGNAEEKVALQEAREREERVELLRRQIGRRMMNADLTRGFTAWQEHWGAKAYALGKLQQVAGRLRTPQLAAAFSFWNEYFEAKRRAREQAALEAEQRSLEGQLRSVRFEHGQLMMVKVAQDDEIAALKLKLRSATEDGREKEKALEAQAPLLEILPVEVAELKEIVKQAQKEAEEAAKQRETVEGEVEKFDASNAQLLERLLAEQRATFESEHSDERKAMEREGEERKSMQSELTSMKKELISASTKLEYAMRLEPELESLKEKLREARDQATSAEKQVEALNKKLLEMPKPAPPKPKEPPPKKKSKGLLGDVDLDEGPDAPPISQQIASALRASAGRVMDLLREWDADGDGEISRKEFHAAMPKLGLEVPKAAIDELFNEWDADGGGSLEFKELQKILRSPPKAPGPAAAVAKAKK